MPDGHTDLRAKIRARGQTVTAFRLGQEAGRSGLDLPVPYAIGSHSEQLYLDGKFWGQRDRSNAVSLTRSAG